MDEQTIFNLLECSVCLEPLDVTSRVLPCQHTFCLRCLQQIITARNELKCPECRDVAACRAVTELPTNILLVRLLDGLKRPAKAPGSPPPGTSSSGVPGVGEMSVSGRSTSTKTSIQNQPCAMALYKYDAQEHGDLSFNKSDLILLHKKIDDNWYQGVVMGSSDQIGFFPASYAQVLTPLPPDPPQCKALYDFEVNEREEKDCLTFNKDEVLNVIRRVDENWVEGKKGDKIGIFPLSFVELNGTAKALVDAHAGIDGGSGPSHQSQGSGDAGSSPDQAGSSQEGGSKNKAKRHSFTSLLGLSTSAQSKSKESQPSTPASTSASSSTSNATTSTSSNSNRHSMEISSPVLVRSSNPTAANLIDSKTTTTQQQAAAGTAAPSASPAPAGTAAEASPSTAVSARKKPAPLTGISQIPAVSTRGPNSPSMAASPTVTQAGNAEFRFVGEAPASPKPKVEVYVAMYSYKPAKADELELKKGDFYTVTERCKDGWFKGMAVKTGDLGVFPGNYMQAYRPDRSSRKTSTTQATESRPSQSTSTAISSGQGIRPRLSSDAASRASSSAAQRTNSEAPASPSPVQGLRPRVMSDASSRMAAQRAAAAAAAATAVAEVAASSPGVSLSSATTQTSGARPSATRPGGQPPLPTSPSPMPVDRRTMSHMANGQKTVAQMQSERAAQQMQFRSPPPNFPVRPGLSTVGQTRASHPDKNVRGSPPTVGTQTAAVAARTTPGQAGPAPPQPPVPQGAQIRHAGASSAPVSARPRVASGQAAVGSPPAQNGIVQRVRSPSSPQPGAQDGSISADGGTSVAKTRGSPVMGQGSPRGASTGAAPPQSTPPQKDKKDRKVSKKRSQASPEEGAPVPQARASSLPDGQEAPATEPCPTPPAPQGEGSGEETSLGAEGVSDGASAGERRDKPPKTTPLVRERYRVMVSYPTESEAELELKVGETVFVHSKREDGWYKGTQQRTGKTGLFPGNFVESY